MQNKNIKHLSSGMREVEIKARFVAGEPRRGESDSREIDRCRIIHRLPDGETRKHGSPDRETEPGPRLAGSRENAKGNAETLNPANAQGKVRQWLIHSKKFNR
jgi:hypothetical protein